MDRVKEFLQKNWDQKSPLLLGYSGGSDSKALLYLLLELGVFPHLAHVDHGWREESRKEAEELRQEAEALGLSFHTIRLVPDPREAAAREMRLEFFASLFEKIPFQALLLAHQADDLAETALKRVLEGAHLIHLGGMREISKMGPLAIWRPLLHVPRRDIIAYLESKRLAAIQDSSNSDPRYLRARMRIEILPKLAKMFGKEVSANLAHLGKRANELKEYLDRRTDEALKRIQTGPWGLALPPSTTEPIEIRHLLQRIKIPFTRPILDRLVDALARGQANRRFDQRMIADRGYFFYLAKNLPQFDEPVPVRPGIYHSGHWRIDITKACEPICSDWRDVWRGRFSLTLPEGIYWLQASKSLNSMRKMMNEKRIPAFFRLAAPHICQNGEMPMDLLSGRKFSGKPVFELRFSIDPTGYSSRR